MKQWCALYVFLYSYEGKFNTVNAVDENDDNI